jgi:hypothetical protein
MGLRRRHHTSSIRQKALLSASLTRQVVRNQTRFRCVKPWLITSFKHKTCSATQLSKLNCQTWNKQRLYFRQNRQLSVQDPEWNLYKSIRQLLQICTKLRVQRLASNKTTPKKTKMDFRSQLQDKYSILKLLLLRMNKLQLVKLNWLKYNPLWLKHFNSTSWQQWQTTSLKLN